MKQLCAHDNRKQRDHRHKYRHDDFTHGCAIQRTEKLRAALVSDGIDKEREHDVLERVVKLHASLTDDDGRQQGTRNSAKLKATEVNFSKSVAKSERKKQRGLRRVLENRVEPAVADSHGCERDARLRPLHCYQHALEASKIPLAAFLTSPITIAFICSPLIFPILGDIY